MWHTLNPPHGHWVYLEHLQDEGCGRLQDLALLEGQPHQQQQQHQREVDLDVDAFVNGIAFSLQKSSGQQCEQLFTEIRNLIYDTLYPKHATAPRPCPIQ